LRHVGSGAKVTAEGGDGVDDGRADLGDDAGPDLGVAAGELGAEGGVVGFPVVEGLAVDLEGLADEALVVAGEEAVEGGELFLGEVGGGGVKMGGVIGVIVRGGESWGILGKGGWGGGGGGGAGGIVDASGR
jgi:hypothetical protein